MLKTVSDELGYKEPAEGDAKAKEALARKKEAMKKKQEFEAKNLDESGISEATAAGSVSDTDATITTGVTKEEMKSIEDNLLNKDNPSTADWEQNAVALTKLDIAAGLGRKDATFPQLYDEMTLGRVQNFECQQEFHLFQEDLHIQEHNEEYVFAVPPAVAQITDSAKVAAWQNRPPENFLSDQIFRCDPGQGPA